MNGCKFLRPEHLNPTTRFSKKVQDYIKYRPSYPSEIIQEIIINKFKSNELTVIADIGSGTGKFSHLILSQTSCDKVYCIEPNKEMREAAEFLLQNEFPNRFISVNGTGENTILENNSCDIVVSAQAFHWFNLIEAKNEFKRILKRDGNVLLLWNFRNDEIPVLKEYDELMKKYSKNYDDLSKRFIEKEDLNFLFEGKYNEITFPYKQYFDLESFKGRMCSSSYCPDNYSKEYQLLMDELTQIYERYNKNGKIEFVYNSTCYYGKL